MWYSAPLSLGPFYRLYTFNSDFFSSFIESILLVISPLILHFNFVCLIYNWQTYKHLRYAKNKNWKEKHQVNV